MCGCLAAHSCLTLCNPVDCSLPGFSVHGDSPGKNTGVSCHALLQDPYFYSIRSTRMATYVSLLSQKLSIDYDLVLLYIRHLSQTELVNWVEWWSGE